MEIIVSSYAGVCHGVGNALKTINSLLGSGRKIYSYGTLIHNRKVTDMLAKNGVTVVDRLNAFEIDKNALYVLRAHGVPPDIYETLENCGAEYVDCTCRDVKKIHDIVSRNKNEGRRCIIIGDRSHPEVLGIMGYAGTDAIVVETEEQAKNAALDCATGYALVVQTTFTKEKFDLIIEEIKKKDLDINIYDTTCKATVLRQSEAARIAGLVDYMLVLGDKSSSNTTKLYEICKKICRNTFFIETIDEIELNIFSNNDKIGITAGASTPSEIIKEAVTVMSEIDTNMNNQSFAEMLDETLVTLHTGNVVKGTVIQVVNGEVSVNLGYKSDGIIPRSEFSDDPTLDPADVVKPGDVIDVFVVRVNDSDGNVMLSKKKIDMGRNYDMLEEAFNNKTPLPGKVIDIVKGGLIALIGGVRVFVPSSQASNRYVEDLTRFKGKEFNFSILEFDKNKRRFVAGRKALAAQELIEKKEKVFSTLEVGSQVSGTVSRIVDFGAFVDLGGVDGLIHISELSWGRVKKVKDVLTEGDTVNVTVLDMDKAKGKISLSLKDATSDPWHAISDKYPVGSVVEGKVVRMVPFGAFIELEDGVDGLIHISQIAAKHVVRPEDELTIGEIIKAKVTDIDLENKRISLSKKEADAMYVGSLGAGAENADTTAQDQASEPKNADAGAEQAPAVDSEAAPATNAEAAPEAEVAPAANAEAAPEAEAAANAEAAPEAEAAANAEATPEA